MEPDSAESISSKNHSSDPTYHPKSSHSYREASINNYEAELISHPNNSDHVDSDPVDWDRLLSSESSGTSQRSVTKNLRNESRILVDHHMASSSYLYYPDVDEKGNKNEKSPPEVEKGDCSVARNDNVLEGNEDDLRRRKQTQVGRTSARKGSITG
jgi:hypothetical protein